MAVVDREQQIQQIQQNAQVSRTTAEFIYAIEAGEIEGDAINENGEDPDKDARLDDRQD